MAICLKDFPSLIPREFQHWFDDPKSADGLAWADVEERSMDPEKKRVRFVASDDTVDFDNEIVEAGAFHDLRHLYLSHPSILANHQHVLASGMSAVIAKTLELQTEKDPVWGVGEFIDTAIGNDHAKAVFSGAQRGVSVGFKAVERHPHKGRTVITKALLVEVSFVAVGKNPNALICNYVLGHLADEARRTSDRGLADEALAAVRELAAKLDLMERRFDPFKSIEGNGDTHCSQSSGTRNGGTPGPMREMELRLARLEESFAGDDPVVKDWQEKLAVAEHLGRVVESVEARFRS